MAAAAHSRLSIWSASKNSTSSNGHIAPQASIKACPGRLAFCDLRARLCLDRARQPLLLLELSEVELACLAAPWVPCRAVGERAVSHRPTQDWHRRRAAVHVKVLR